MQCFMVEYRGVAFLKLAETRINARNQYAKYYSLRASRVTKALKWKICVSVDQSNVIVTYNQRDIIFTEFDMEHDFEFIQITYHYD